MRDDQAAVRLFQEKYGLLPDESHPDLRGVERAFGLITEEYRELEEALQNGDVIGTIDGLCDLVFVCYAAANVWGIDLEPYWQEVCRSNLTKTVNPVAGGKPLKLPGVFEEPRLAAILTAGLARAVAAGRRNGDEGDRTESRR